MFTTYELNPVALSAQASVAVPDGLDLNAWILPPPPQETDEPTSDAELVRAKKSKKGKGKEPAGAKPKRKKRRENGEADVLAPAAEETEEERAERERVCPVFHSSWRVCSVFTSETHFAIQRKAERMERMRDDPFYLGDDRPAARGKVEDVDAIPVVRLDDMPPLPQPPGESSRQVPCRKTLGFLTILPSARPTSSKSAELAAPEDATGVYRRQAWRDAEEREVCEPDTHERSRGAVGRAASCARRSAAQWHATARADYRDAQEEGEEE